MSDERLTEDPEEESIEGDTKAAFNRRRQQKTTPSSNESSQAPVGQDQQASDSHTPLLSESLPEVPEGTTRLAANPPPRFIQPPPPPSMPPDTRTDQESVDDWLMNIVPKDLGGAESQAAPVAEPMTREDRSPSQFPFNIPPRRYYRANPPPPPPPDFSVRADTPVTDDAALKRASGTADDLVGANDRMGETASPPSGKEAQTPRPTLLAVSRGQNLASVLAAIPERQGTEVILDIDERNPLFINLRELHELDEVAQDNGVTITIASSNSKLLNAARVFGFDVIDTREVSSSQESTSEQNEPLVTQESTDTSTPEELTTDTHSDSIARNSSSNVFMEADEQADALSNDLVDPSIAPFDPNPDSKADLDIRSDAISPATQNLLSDETVTPKSSHTEDADVLTQVDQDHITAVASQGTVEPPPPPVDVIDTRQIEATSEQESQQSQKPAEAPTDSTIIDTEQPSPRGLGKLVTKVKAVLGRKESSSSQKGDATSEQASSTADEIIGVNDRQGEPVSDREALPTSQVATPELPPLSDQELLDRINDFHTPYDSHIADIAWVFTATDLDTSSQKLKSQILGALKDRLRKLHKEHPADRRLGDDPNPVLEDLRQLADTLVGHTHIPFNLLDADLRVEGGVISTVATLQEDYQGMQKLNQQVASSAPWRFQLGKKRRLEEQTSTLARFEERYLRRVDAFIERISPERLPLILYASLEDPEEFVSFDAVSIRGAEYTDELRELADVPVKELPTLASVLSSPDSRNERDGQIAQTIIYNHLQYILSNGDVMQMREYLRNLHSSLPGLPLSDNMDHFDLPLSINPGWANRTHLMSNILRAHTILNPDYSIQFEDEFLESLIFSATSVEEKKEYYKQKVATITENAKAQGRELSEERRRARTEQTTTQESDEPVRTEEQTREVLNQLGGDLGRYMVDYNEDNHLSNFAQETLDIFVPDSTESLLGAHPKYGPRLEFKAPDETGKQAEKPEFYTYNGNPDSYTVDSQGQIEEEEILPLVVLGGSLIREVTTIQAGQSPARERALANTLRDYLALEGINTTLDEFIGDYKESFEKFIDNVSE